MARNGNNQIFYSNSPKRWLYSKRTIVGISIFLISIFSITVASIILGPTLPQIGLADNETVYRRSLSIPKSITPKASAEKFSVTTPAIIPGVTPVPELPKNLSPNRLSTIKTTKTKILGFYVNWDDNSFISLKENVENIDQLVPEWLHLGDDMNPILINDQTAQEKTFSFAKKAHPELLVTPLINNYNQDTQSWDVDRLSSMLSTPASRLKTIEALLEFVRKNKFDGISIDFEVVPSDQQVNLVSFMKELYDKFHPLHLEVSQSIPLSDDSFDAKILSQYSDFLILMAYDEHVVFSTTQGAIASHDWIVNGLQARLLEAPMNEYVIALGAYGYDWFDNETSGKELIFQETMSIAKEAGAEISFDPTSLNPTFDYVDENEKLHHVWFLDGVTVFNEMVTSETLGGTVSPYGFALWRLGGEDPSVWQAFSNRERLNKLGADSLTTLRYGYDISYNSSGEVIKVTSVPQDGFRKLIFDEQSGLIKN